MDLIIKALVEAGYFRARISTLSDFDKVIGGMAWAMQVFSQEIDINIFYRDTLDLGQKIALTERLVMVLIVMKCPYKIEPHQIVGLDHVNLLPVIKWLIKRSGEIRREHEAFNRLLALRHYHRVTNTLENRNDWCHVVGTAELKALETKQAGTTDAVETASAKFIARLKRDFHDHQLVSFVNSQPAFISAADDSRAARIDNQNISAEDELSDESEGGAELGTDNVDEENIFNAQATIQLTRPTFDDNSDPLSKDEPQESTEQAALHKELDTELMATNQKILTLLKKLDSMPTDSEIIQYQRRYIELHQELISKNKDLKKIYALFNSLDSIRHYLTKELNLLDSIMSNLDLTNNNPSNRFEFLRQFQEIIAKIQSVRNEFNDRLDVMRKKCDLLNDEYVGLRDSYEESM